MRVLAYGLLLLGEIWSIAVARLATYTRWVRRRTELVWLFQHARLGRRRPFGRGIADDAVGNCWKKPSLL